MNAFGKIPQWLHAIAPPFVIRLKNRVLGSNLGARVARGSLWNLLAGGVSRSLALVGSIIIARILGKETFGELGILQSTLEMFGSFAAFGMGLTSIKYVAECRKSDPDKAGRILAMSSLVACISGGIGTVLLIGFSPLLATKALAAPHLSPLLQISAFSLLFGAINGAQIGGLVGFEAFKQIAQINLIAGLLTIAFRVTGTIGWGLEGAVYGMVAAQITGCAVNFVVLRGQAAKAAVSIRYRHCFRELSVLWRFSLPTVLGSLMLIPANWLCNAMLVNRPQGYQEMAVYNAANQWFFVLLFIPGLMGEAALPVLYDRVAARDHQSARKVFFASMKLNSVVILPLALLGLFSKHVMSFYGRDFANGWQTMVVMLATAGLQAIQLPAGYMITSSGRMWLVFLMNLGWAASFVLFYAVLVAWGSLGLALARFLGLCLHFSWTFAFALHSLRKVRQPGPQGTSMAEVQLAEEELLKKGKDVLDSSKTAL